MKINNMFVKDINRDITGVVKVAQQNEEEVHKELEEYVVTNELQTHFSDFFEAYQKGITGFTDKMGVWISGFFGSGKSHFLKILSYILENREVKGKKAINFFDDKIEDQFILANMKSAGDIPTDVILFNVDSKSDSDSKNDKEAIVKVFMKVFNDHMGYCGSIPWLADLERQLDKDGSFQAFKDKFKEISGDEWENRREDFYFEEDAIIKSLVATTQMSEDSARHWYETSEENYNISIEKFARRVEEYIEEQGNNHHVVFLVDEIGQYIGDDGQLMLNLQTVAEDLGTHCGGKAWVMVTSQEAIDQVTKRIKGMDFSKIMGRFDTRLSLSSANVDEVIIKRLLEKKESAQDTLRLLYNEKSAILNNIITFSDDTYDMKNYSNAQEFIDVYPFVPYQFKLLQEVFEEIRRHGATGKHLSEGERSLLSAFQESAQQYESDEEGKLIPFSAFFSPIESFLDSNIRRVITNAINNSRLEDYDVEVLKLLFLIRYIKGLPGNLENLTTLMVSNIDEDKLALKEKIEGSLKRLLRETLIQKNGNEYFFLTNEEQDINKEIKNTSVDMSEVLQNVGDIIFEEIYTDKKYRYSKEYDFGFNQMVDDKLRGRQTEDIGIKILTPYYGETSDKQLLMRSNGENNLILKLPEDTDFLDELEQSLKIETYLRKRSGTNKSETVADIISRKGREQRERKKRAKNLLIDSISDATVYVRGQKLDIKTSRPTEKINEGFKVLIEDIYDKLNYIQKHTKSERELADLMKKDKIQVTLNNEDPNKLAIDEVKVFIDRQNQRKLKTTMKTLIDKFTGIHYGWKELDIAAIVIKLLKAQEINLQYNGEVLDTDDRKLPEYLTKRKYREKLVINKRVKVEQELINNAKKLGRELFETTTLPSDEDNLREELKMLINNEIVTTARSLLRYYNSDKPYPGKNDLQKTLSLFERIHNNKDVHEFFKQLSEEYEDLIKYGRKLEKIKGFFENQKDYFDKALRTIKLYEKNETYIINDEIIDTIKKLKEIVESVEPYGDIHKIPGLRDKFNNVFVKMIEKKCEPVKNTINNDKSKVETELDKHDFSDYFKKNLLDKFDRLLERLETANSINEINSMKLESDTIKKRCFNKIQNKLQQMKKEKKKVNYDSEDEPEVEVVREKEVQNISATDLFTDTRLIKSEEDIDKLLLDLKNKLKKYLNEDKNIQLV